MAALAGGARALGRLIVLGESTADSATSTPPTDALAAALAGAATPGERAETL